jgi:uncharacterized protein (UPF0276 family)
MRPPGVGLVYSPELAPLFEDRNVVNVLELEPQVFWDAAYGQGGLHYRVSEAVLEQIAQFPQRKLLHGIGQPVGGTVDDPLEYLEPLRHVIERLDPEWISEHLSFNRTCNNGQCKETGFLLPPRQSSAGIAKAVSNIKRYSQQVALPFAFETGVNYLRSRPDEVEDGAFFAAIAAQAECGILLDLHNLWCNERNGRQPVLDVVDQIPLERVWELHLAGGMKYEGYWLDAHSDAVPEQVVQIAAKVVPRLPNLAAIIFEILPYHLHRVGIDGVYRQLEALHELWNLKMPQLVTPSRLAAMRGEHREYIGHCPSAGEGEVVAWERALVAALGGCAISDYRFMDLVDDPGTDVLRQLVGDARRSSLARALRYTTLLLLLNTGPSETHELLDEYFSNHAPESFASLEANHFATFLQGRALCDRIPYLAETLAFEQALVRAIAFGATTDLVWSIDPTALFESLDKGCAPRGLRAVRSTMRVSPTALV